MLDKGGITQLAECVLCKHKVIGSSPITSKILNNKSLQAGFEPTSKWLTATCSTTELLKTILRFIRFITSVYKTL
jgi:hypothetical protein